MGKLQRHKYTPQTRAKRSVISQQVTTRHQQTDVHESITEQDRNSINDPQKKHRLGTVSKNILLEGLNRLNGAPTSPLVQDRLSLNVREHSAILSTFNTLPFVLKTFVLPIFVTVLDMFYCTLFSESMMARILVVWYLSCLLYQNRKEANGNGNYPIINNVLTPYVLMTSSF